MRLKESLLLIAVVWGLAGCGGMGLGNPFAGNFTNEPWSQLSPSDSGTITLNITALGTVSGTLVDSGASQSYTVNGLIDDNGVLTATITPNGGSASSLSGTMSFSGNQLVGTLSDSGGPLNTIVVN